MADLMKKVCSIFVAITEFQKTLSNRCHRGYEDTIARIIREQLEVIFYRMLEKQRPNEDEQALKSYGCHVKLGNIWSVCGMEKKQRENRL